MPTQPNERACPKCGGMDVGLRYYAEGVNVVAPNAGPYHCPSPLPTEIIRHHCRGCHYEWDGRCLDATKAGEG